MHESGEILTVLFCRHIGTKTACKHAVRRSYAQNSKDETKMWYVVQTLSGDEQKLRMLIEHMDGVERKAFIPMIEEVRRRSDRYHIAFRRLFPGYVFVETDDPEKLFKSLRTIPDFTRLLGSTEEDGERNFIPVDADDERFLRSILHGDGLVHVSYAHLSDSNRLDKVVGPLAGYRNYITKLEFRRRIAVVEAEIFGKRRRIPFGLWTDGDPRIPWLEQQMKTDQGIALDEGVEEDIGIRAGDRVIDETEVYGDRVFVVKKVDAKCRSIVTTFEMGDMAVNIKLAVENIRKIDNGED